MDTISGGLSGGRAASPIADRIPVLTYFVTYTINVLLRIKHESPCLEHHTSS